MIFRYPGGKGKMSKLILEHIPRSDKQPFAEPFVGGGSIVLAVAKRDRNRKLYINDLDPWVSSFWETVVDDQSSFDDLVKAVGKKPTISQFKNLRDKFAPQDFFLRGLSSPEEAAYNALFFNRTTFSGIFSSGPIGGDNQEGSDWKIDCRWNPGRLQEELHAARAVMLDRTTITCTDFEMFFNGIPKNSFIYADPPYYKQGDALYGASMGGPAGHRRFYDALTKFPSWLLSYDNCEEIREMYTGFKTEEFYKFRSMGVQGSKELRDAREKAGLPRADRPRDKSELLIDSRRVS